MAQTHKDKLTKLRIKSVMEQFKDKPKKELIYIISSVCNLTHRTASEHYHSITAQKTIGDVKINIDCEHDWSNYFTTPGGLCKECKLCSKTKYVKVEQWKTPKQEDAIKEEQRKSEESVID